MRMRLAGKIVLASLPIAVAALLATGYLAWTFLEDASVHDETARAATVASEAMVSLRTLWTEEQLARPACLGQRGSGLPGASAKKDKQRKHRQSA